MRKGRWSDWRDCEVELRKNRELAEATETWALPSITGLKIKAMGCCAIRKPFQDEETTITLFESQLNFQANSPAATFETIQIHSHNARITTAQLNTISQLLQLQLEDSQDRAATSRLLQSFSKGGAVDSRKLLLLGISLSHGTDNDKAEAFFEVMDSEHKGRVVRAQVRSLIEDLTDVLVNSSLLLVPEETKIAEYQTKLRVGRAKSILHLEQSIMAAKEFITKEAFCAAFKNPQVEVLAVPKKLRAYLVFSQDSQLA